MNTDCWNKILKFYYKLIVRTIGQTFKLIVQTSAILNESLKTEWKSYVSKYINRCNKTISHMLSLKSDDMCACITRQTPNCRYRIRLNTGYFLTENMKQIINELLHHTHIINSVRAITISFTPSSIKLFSYETQSSVVYFKSLSNSYRTHLSFLQDTLTSAIVNNCTIECPRDRERTYIPHISCRSLCAYSFDGFERLLKCKNNIKNLIAKKNPINFRTNYFNLCTNTKYDLVRTTYKSYGKYCFTYEDNAWQLLDSDDNSFGQTDEQNMLEILLHAIIL